MKRVKARYRDRDIKKKTKYRNDEKTEAVSRNRILGIGTFNMNGKTVKGMEDVKKAVTGQDISIMCLVETHVRKEDRKGPNIEGYDTHQACREGNDKKGGGLAILTKKGSGLAFKRYSPEIANVGLSYVNKERMWITYESLRGKTAVCCVYLGCHNDDGRHKEHNRGIYKVLSEEVYALRGKGFRIILQGDFNCWVGSDLRQGGIPGNRRKTNSSGEAFKEFLAGNALAHVNGACRVAGDWSTRISEGLWTRHGSDYVSSSVLDYVVVSTEHMDTVMEMVIDEKGKLGGGSDHNMIVTKVKDQFLSPQGRVNKKRSPGWDIQEDQDWTEYKSVVTKEIEKLGYDDEGVEFLDYSITKVITKGLEVGIGRRRTGQAESRRLFPKHIVKEMREQSVLERTWKTEKSEFASSRSPNPPESLIVAADALKRKTEEVKEKILSFQRSDRAPIKKLCKMKSKRGRQMFWKYVSRKHHKLEDVSALQNKTTGVLRCTPEGVSEEIFGYLKDIFSGTEEPLEEHDEPEESAFKEQVEHDHGYARKLPEGPVEGHEYASTGKLPPPPPPPPPNQGSGEADSDPREFLDKTFSKQEIKDIIKDLGNEKASGHDMIPNEALKNAPPALLEMILKLFNRVKNKGESPKSWKRGRLVLIHKKGSTVDAYNYRPLTVLTVVSGLYTKVLNQRLVSVVECHGLLGEIQNGFRKTRSGGDNAFVLNTVLWKSSAKKKEVHLAFLDLMKAYDSVDR